VEAYLLDFEGDLYDRRLRLEVLEHLRDEQRFASIDALKAQIAADVERVRELLS
jgi:riboflavin kinase/FMN adenylyltransferase